MQTVTVPPAPVKDYDAMRVVWTRTDCEALERAGVLPYRYELIDGVILRKMSQYLRHARLVRRATQWPIGQFGEEYVFDQTGIHVRWDGDSTNAPEPDVILLNKPDTAITTDQPRPEDIQLLVEIASRSGEATDGGTSTTKNYDLGTKAALYARAGVPEYWVVSVDERTIYVHTAPTPDGSYTRTEASDTETLAPACLPPGAAGIHVSELLPPAANP